MLSFVADSTQNTTGHSDEEFQRSLTALFKSIEPDCDELSDQSSTSISPCGSHDSSPSSPVPSLVSAIDVTPASPQSDSRSFSLEFFEASTSAESKPFIEDLRVVLESECRKVSPPNALLSSLLLDKRLPVHIRENSLQNRWVTAYMYNTWIFIAHRNH